MPPAALAVGIQSGHEAAYIGSFEVEAGGSAVLSGAHSVILGSSAAQRYQTDGSGEPVETGDRVEIQGERFTVVGVLKPSSMLYAASAIMPLETAQEVFRRPGSVSAVILTADRLDAVESIQADIQQRFPDLQVSTQDEIAENTEAVLAGQRTFFDLIDGTVIVVAIVVVTIVVVVAVMEQRREIGTLRALGARRWRIFSLVFSEALALSMLGAIAALPMSLTFRAVMELLVSGNAAEVGGLFDLNPVPAWIGTIGVAVLIGLLASLLPAWQAMRVDPLESLRYE
jgi:putative ABC transport system permease protein